MFWSIAIKTDHPRLRTFLTSVPSFKTVGIFPPTVKCCLPYLTAAVVPATALQSTQQLYRANQLFPEPSVNLDHPSVSTQSFYPFSRKSSFVSFGYRNSNCISFWPPFRSRSKIELYFIIPLNS